MALKQSFHTIIEKSSAQIKFDLLSFHCYFTTIFQSNFSSTSQKMSTTARRRLMRDFKRLQEDPPEGVSGAPGENNIMVWNAVIFGPHETPFEDGTFKLMVCYF